MPSVAAGGGDASGGKATRRLGRVGLLEPARLVDNRVLDEIEQSGYVDTILLAPVVTR